ncbi:MAG: VWA domain-containing protein [Acidobacteria bacterium]|nr:VWA domain-containing protein [Acidobacteriota bacterium]
MNARFGPIIVLLTFAAFCSGTISAQQKEKQKGQEEQVEGVSSITVKIPAVTVNVTVTDKRGNLIKGLTKDYFKVYEDGKEQEITNFFPDEAPLSIVLLLETSRQIQGLEYDYWYATLDFIRNLRREDYCALVTYDMKPRIAADFTLDKNKIISEANVNLYFKGFNESNLSDAIIFVLERMAEVDGKKAVVLLSTGLDTFSKRNYDDAIEVAESSDTVVYAISMGQLVRLRYETRMSDILQSDFRFADLRLKTFAKITGGESYFPRFATEYPAIFQNILLYLRYQYTLAYTPRNQDTDDEKRKIEVKAFFDMDGDGKMDELKVRHKKTYRVAISE